MEKLVCVSDFEEAALEKLNRNARNYFRSGADEENTLSENQRAFHRWIIRPRVLRDVSRRILWTTVLGKPVAHPIGVSPTAMQKMCHEEGEVANARAAATMRTIFILSMVSNCSLEEVAAATPGARRWFHLYMFASRVEVATLVRRAEKAGYEAIVLTVDAPRIGKRRTVARNGFQYPPHLRLGNYPTGQSNPETDRIVTKEGATVTWDDVDWLLEHSVDAIIVSNHGGRQLDTVSPTIDVLEEVVHAVNGRCEVYMDGGVRSGSDAFKALALGARMVFAGRPFLWGLAVGGEAGAQRVHEILRDELDLTMSLAGVATVEDIDRSYICRASSM